MRSYFLPFLILLLFFSVFQLSTSEIDSLKAEIQKREGIKKTENINRLALKIRKLSLVSSYKYAQFAMDRAVNQNDYEGLAVSNKTMALYYHDKNEKYLAIKYIASSESNYQIQKKIIKKRLTLLR